MGLKHLPRLAVAAVLLLTAGSGCPSDGNGARGSIAIDGPVATRSLASSVYIGSVDEVIGPEGRLGTGFDDADFRQLRRPDAILPVYHPRFLGADEADLPDDELIIGIEINGDARAYPAGLLYHREIVNDSVGGVLVLVTWCPLCYTALVHDRRLNGDATVERQNLTMRMGMRRFTRLTNAFSKKLEIHCHMLALYFVHYNFCRPHTTLNKRAAGYKTTPAMAAGLTERAYDMAWLVDLVNANQPKPAKRGPYGPRKAENSN